MKAILLSLLTIFSIIDCFSQKLDTKYYFFSNDTLLTDHYLTFKNDSIVQISSIPRHMWQPMQQELKYEKLYEKLIIHIDTSLHLDNYGYNCDKELTIKKKTLINELRQEIYVIRKDFDKNPDAIVMFNDKEYKIDSGETNGYGLVTKSAKKNRRLKRKLKTVNLNEYEINTVKGYEAYKKFGYKYVFGVIELKKK